MIAGVMGMVSTGDSSTSSSSSKSFPYHRQPSSHTGLTRNGRGSSLKYFVLSTIGAMVILIAIGIYYGEYNALNIAVIASRMQFTLLDQIALVLVMAALAMKCGSVPMHFWTPEPIRWPGLNHGDAGRCKPGKPLRAFQGALYYIQRHNECCNRRLDSNCSRGALDGRRCDDGIPQKDVKRLMAYHAVSQTGYMLLGVGVGLAVLGNQSLMDAFGYMAMEGGIFHIINHAMYKGLLFLTAGAIFLRIGTRNLNKMGGLGHNMKYTMIFFIIGALAIAGIPPFNGFASKLMIYESVLSSTRSWPSSPWS